MSTNVRDARAIVFVAMKMPSLRNMMVALDHPAVHADDLPRDVGGFI